MKILYITTGCFDKGGISRYSRYQIKALKEIYGYENIKVLSFLGPDNDSFEEKMEVNYHGNANNIFQRILFFWKILEYSFTFRPLVIHSAHINYAGVLSLIAKFIKSSFILNIYGLEIWTNFTFFKKYGLKSANLVISDCFATKEYVIKEELIKSEKYVQVIWDCVDVDHFYPKNEFGKIEAKFNLPDRNNNVIISTLGRISEDAAYKGYERLIYVFARISEKVLNVRLLIIGRGNLIPYLKSICHQLKINNKVIFTDSVSDIELPYILSYSHIFSLVTESGLGKGEGLPLTPLEAMACGNPIIVGNEDGSREAVFNSSNGFVVNSKNPEESFSALTKLILNPGLRDEMRKNALEVVSNNFTYNIFKLKLNSLYQNLIK